MSDILQQIDVHVHCIQCDEEYTVPASAITRAEACGPSGASPSAWRM